MVMGRIRGEMGDGHFFGVSFWGLGDGSNAGL